MNRTTNAVAILLGLSVACQCVDAQSSQSTVETPVATQWVLDGAHSQVQRTAIKSVVMIICPKDSKKGTGFLLAHSGIIVTNAHVVGNCTAQELKITSSLGSSIVLSNAQPDKDRDLALLCPTNGLHEGLTLGPDAPAAIETEVETWGYPLTYQNPAPILSRGYVAGYIERAQPNHAGHSTRHLIVNGAFNPGNSGGPLVDRSTGMVIGVVVEKWGLFSPLAEMVIRDLEHPNTLTISNLVQQNANGEKVMVSQQEAIAAVLTEFYGMSQVMIGEAISVAELNAFLKEKQTALACGR